MPKIHVDENIIKFDKFEMKALLNWNFTSEEKDMLERNICGQSICPYKVFFNYKEIKDLLIKYKIIPVQKDSPP